LFVQATFVITHEFVEFIPDELKQDTLYISIRFATVSHLCCCGRGNKIVTPLRPTDWRLIFDGKTVSLDPSIGNWSFPCKSHYWITNNRVRWAPQWSKERIEAGRAHDRLAKEKYFHAPESTAGISINPPPETSASNEKQGVWKRLRAWCFSRRR
jgi:Family of unknown function (DUF6527)